MDGNLKEGKGHVSTQTACSVTALTVFRHPFLRAQDGTNPEAADWRTQCVCFFPWPCQ